MKKSLFIIGLFLSCLFVNAQMTPVIYTPYHRPSNQNQQNQSQENYQNQQQNYQIQPQQNYYQTQPQYNYQSQPQQNYQSQPQNSNNNYVETFRTTAYYSDRNTSERVQIKVERGQYGDYYVTEYYAQGYLDGNWAKLYQKAQVYKNGTADSDFMYRAYFNNKTWYFNF